MTTFQWQVVVTLVRIVMSSIQDLSSTDKDRKILEECLKRELSKE